CACPMGLAHTYMAAEALEKAAKKLGYEIKVETQGAEGIVNELTKEDLDSADIIITALAITPEKYERFDSYDVYEVSLQDAIKDAEGIINSIVDGERKPRTSKKPQESSEVKQKEIKNKESGGFWSELTKHIMTGISNMIPFLIMGGLILAFSQLILYAILGVDPSLGIMDAMNSGLYSGSQLTLLKISQVCLDFGGRLFGFAIPMFAGFMAMSIAGRLAFPAGFIGGIMATSPMSVIKFTEGEYALETPVASSFLGA